MQAMLLGAVRRVGVSKKNGAPYDFSVLHTTRPISSSSSEQMQVSGAGMQPAEIRCSAEVVASLAQAAKWPARYDLTIDNVLGTFGNLEAICTSVAPIKAVG